ncbi:HEAT repeat domain-containing protein [Rhizobium mongolense]
MTVKLTDLRDDIDKVIFDLRRERNDGEVPIDDAIARVRMELNGKISEAADQLMRAAAVNALTFTTHPAAAAAVALGDANWQVRAAAAESLGRIGHGSAVEALGKALSDEYWQVQQKSLGALGKLKANAALAPDRRDGFQAGIPKAADQRPVAKIPSERPNVFSL